MNILKEYKNIEETTETLLSLLLSNKKSNDILKYLNDHLDKAKNISNPIKKHKINNRLFNLITFIQEKYDEEEIIHSIFLVHEKIIEYKLNKIEITNYIS